MHIFPVWPLPYASHSYTVVVMETKTSKKRHHATVKRLARAAASRAMKASQVASLRAARRRNNGIADALQRMAAAGLSLGEMAQGLRDQMLLTPRGNSWWSRQQVQQQLRHALRGMPEAAAQYLATVGIAKATPVDRDYGTTSRKRRKWQDDKSPQVIRHRYRDENPEAPLRQRIRSRVKRVPAPGKAGE
jgi:hypothetical protein